MGKGDPSFAGQSMEIRTRERQPRHFVASALGSGICALLLGIAWTMWFGYTINAGDPGPELNFMFAMASVPFVFGFAYAAFVRWFTDIDFRRCVRANLIAFGGYCLAALVIGVVSAGSTDGDFGLGFLDFVVMATYYELGVLAIASLLIAIGSAVGFGLSLLAHRTLNQRKVTASPD